MKGLFCFLMSLLIGFDAFGQQPPALETNGCGAKGGWSSLLVPNSAAIPKCDFLTACNKHDICYGRCLAGGDLFGQATCNVETDRQKRRAVCDAALQSNIKFDNKSTPLCSLYAAVYKWAVVNFAADAFRGVGGQATQLTGISDFLAYVEKRPDSFEQEDVELAFERLNAVDSPNLDGFMVNFIPGIPSLSVAARNIGDGKYVNLIDIKGKSINK